MFKNSKNNNSNQIKLIDLKSSINSTVIPFGIAATEGNKEQNALVPKPKKRPLKRSETLAQGVSRAVPFVQVTKNDATSDDIEDRSSEQEEAKNHVPAVKYNSAGKTPDEFDIPIYGAVDVQDNELFKKLLARAVDSQRVNSFGKKVIAPVVKTPCSLVVHMYDNVFHWMCRSFEIIGKVKASNGEIYADIQVNDDLSNQNIRVPIDVFEKSNLKELSKYGISVNYGYELPVSIYCKKILETLPMTSAQQQLGFSYHNNKLAFEGYSNDELQTLNTCGSIDSYISELNDLICDSIPIQYLLSASMSAAVMTALKMTCNLDLHSYIINVVGASSTGKTITSRLCASLWSDPNKDNIFTAMLSTNNAMFKKLGGRFGVPMFLDESTIVGNINTSEFGYTIYEEREKHRLNPDCSERVSGTWNTIVVMTSEEHFHASEKSQNGGLVVRIHNAENLEFTLDSEHADEISDFVTKNYGVLGKLFVEHLIAHTDVLISEYNMAKIIMRSNTAHSYNSYTDRLCDTYALTYMTAGILTELGLRIDQDEVAAIMQEQNKNITAEYNIAENALQAIKAFVAGHDSSTEINRYYNGTNQSVIASVAITENLTKKILSDAGFRDLKTTIREIDKAGYLIRQGKEKANGLKSKLHINKVPVVCYQFKLDLEVEPPKPMLSPHEIKKVLEKANAEDYEWDFEDDEDDE